MNPFNEDNTQKFFAGEVHYHFPNGTIVVQDLAKIERSDRLTNIADVIDKYRSSHKAVTKAIYHLNGVAGFQFTYKS